MMQASRALLFAAVSLLMPTFSVLAQQNRATVVVELFTSEGCSSCPPADALLARLGRDQPILNVDIIVLGEHVDYWDSLGWHDRFSSPYLTLRQKTYQSFFNLDDVYTPQIVVSGSAQFTGTDSEGISSAIKKAAAQTVPLQFTSVEVHGNSVSFTLKDGPATHPEYVNVFAALVDPTDTTEVRAGENGGRTLHHAGVVRWIGLIGSSWHMKELGRHPFNFEALLPMMSSVVGPSGGGYQSVPITDGMRLVVFAQTKHIGPILGAASCVLSTTPVPSAAEAPFPANRCPVAPASVVAAQVVALSESSHPGDHLK
jgi:hypothetical protein